MAGVAFSYEPVIPPTIMGSIPASLIEAQRAENDKAASDARARFDEAARRAGVSFDSRVLTASLPGSADRFGEIARRFDLAVVGQAEPGMPAGAQELVAESALFSSGRPVVLVPYIQKAGLDARPRDGVLGCEPHRRPRHRRRDAAARARQGDRRGDRSQASGRRATTSPAPISASISPAMASRSRSSGSSRPTPTSRARSCRTRPTTSADFIVMGGYGHSRLREFMLGGATRGILSAMTVPVLMSH